MRQNKFPEEIEMLYKNLDSEVSWLHARWKIYRQLFAGPPESIFLLNSTAQFFFWNIERILRHNVYLSVSRLLDKETIRGKSNLSFPKLLQVLEKSNYRELFEKLNEFLFTNQNPILKSIFGGVS